MAGIYFSAVTDEHLTTLATKTLLQIKAPDHQRVLVHGVHVSFKGITPTDAPIKVDVLRQTTAGTMTSLTPVKTSDLSSVGEAIQTTAQQNATAEPTPGEVLWSREIPGQFGQTEYFPFNEPKHVPGGTYLGLRVTNGGTSINAIAQFDCQE